MLSREEIIHRMRHPWHRRFLLELQSIRIRRIEHHLGFGDLADDELEDLYHELEKEAEDHRTYTP